MLDELPVICQALYCPEILSTRSLMIDFWLWNNYARLFCQKVSSTKALFLFQNACLSHGFFSIAVTSVRKKIYTHRDHFCYKDLSGARSCELFAIFFCFLESIWQSTSAVLFSHLKGKRNGVGGNRIRWRARFCFAREKSSHTISRRNPSFLCEVWQWVIMDWACVNLFWMI